MIWVLSMVEITAFRLESKSCKGFFLNKFSTNESTQIITGHVLFNLAYTYKFQLKTTLIIKIKNFIQRKKRKPETTTSNYLFRKKSNELKKL